MTTNSLPIPFTSESPLTSTPSNDWGYNPTIKTQHNYIATRRSSQDSTSTTLSQIRRTKQSWETAGQPCSSSNNGKSRKDRRKEVRVHGSWYAQPPGSGVKSGLVASGDEDGRYVSESESAGKNAHGSWYMHHPTLSFSEKVDRDYKYYASVRQRDGWEDKILGSEGIAKPARIWGAAKLLVRHIERPGAVWASKARVVGCESVWYVSRINAGNKIVG